jgi:hypothetical protein
MSANTNRITTIDISDLPRNARQEIYDFYNFLRSKYEVKKDQKEENRKALFMKSIEKQRFHLPDDYTFNRESANER